MRIYPQEPCVTDTERVALAAVRTITQKRGLNSVGAP
jgi:hypothetical protein